MYMKMSLDSVWFVRRIPPCFYCSSGRCSGGRKWCPLCIPVNSFFVPLAYLVFKRNEPSCCCRIHIRHIRSLQFSECLLRVGKETGFVS